MHTLSGKRIVVTGGTGFVGGHLLPLLLSEGCKVTCIVRASSKTSSLPPEVRPIVCDLSNGSHLHEALRDQDILIHMAALLFGCAFTDYLSANTQAAEVLCRTLADLGEQAPKTTLLLSSQAASGPCSDPAGASDNLLPRPVSAYGWSKLLVERTFQSAYQGRLVILRPSIIYGSGDRGLLPMFQGARFGFAVSPGFSRTFPVSCVHGADMAQAILCALAENAHGVYHVSDGRTYTMDEFCREMYSALGKDGHIFHIPLPIMAFSAALSTCWVSLGRSLLGLPFLRGPNWNIDKYREAREDGWICDSSRIRSELGFSPRYSLAMGMRECVDGYRRRGWL